MWFQNKLKFQITIQSNYSLKPFKKLLLFIDRSFKWNDMYWVYIVVYLNKFRMDFWKICLVFNGTTEFTFFYSNKFTFIEFCH